MILDVKYIVRTCKRCQLFRPQSFNYQTEDIATKPGLPFTRVGLDIIGPLPTTKNGNKYNCFSRLLNKMGRSRAN